MAEAPARQSLFQQIRGFPANFWFANFMETLERLAFFGVSAIRALYAVALATENGLGLSYPQKGWALGIWALLQCIIPMVSGGYTDRYGYRKSLAVAFMINILGYLLMAESKPLADWLLAHGVPHAGFTVFLAAACLVGTGTAIFKPAVHGTIARVTTEETSSMAWGIFYLVVNVGGVLAPFGAALLRGQTDWRYVFYAAAVVTALNFLPAFLLYREPEKVPAAAGSQTPKGPVGVFLSSIGGIFRDLRLLAFLLIFACFWLMFMQLWDLLPNFIDEWVDTADVAGAFGAISSNLVLASGQVKPEMIINIDAAAIIVLVIPISWLISRLNKVAAMIIGMVIALVGFVGCGATNLGWLCCLMIFTFAIGEMICSPTFSAYVGLIAPKDKKALYMGYSNIPFAIGWCAGNIISNYMYESLGSKLNLARRYLSEHLQMDRSVVAAIKDADVMQTLTTTLSTTTREATQLLWSTYQPYVVWYYLGIIGLAGTIGMIIFYFTTKSPSSAFSPAGATD